MPSGTGKTVSLLSLIVSYQQVWRFLSLSWRVTFLPVLSNTQKACLLFSNSTRDRESVGGTQAFGSLPDISCGDARGEGEGTQLYGHGFDESQKPLYTPRGLNFFGDSRLSSTHFFVQISKEKKGRVVDARCRDLTNAAVCEKGRADPDSVELCSWHEVYLPYAGGLSADFMKGPWKIRTRESHTTGHMDTGRYFRVWPWQGSLSLFCCSPDGKCFVANSNLFQRW